MHGSADGRPAVAGSDRADIQPSTDLDLDNGPLPADDALDRMLGDTDLLYRLQYSGYAPQDWQPAAAEFARYGHSVMIGWLRSSRIFAEVFHKTRLDLTRPDSPFDDDAIQTLATDTVIAALDAFLEEVLKKHRWDPARGASLKTFFIGQCCLQFSNVYKSWRRAERRLGRMHRASELLEIKRLNPDAANADFPVLRRDEVAEAMGLLSNDVARQAFSMQALGYTHIEIADRLGLADDKAVENLLGYQRRLIAKQIAEERAV